MRAEDGIPNGVNALFNNLIYSRNIDVLKLHGGGEAAGEPGEEAKCDCEGPSVPCRRCPFQKQ